MGDTFLILSGEKAREPNMDQILKGVYGQDSCFQLIFKSPKHIASLGCNYQPGFGCAFYYIEHEELTISQYYYHAVGGKNEFVTVSDEETLELVNFYDGQDYQVEPRVFFIDDNYCTPIIETFLDSGTRDDSVNWQLEDEITERLEKEGCFDGIE